jgi:molybdopterin-guanine dinucleotide biosynthesis protein A
VTLREHKKHAAITRPAYGNFARQEWAIVGTPCGTIKGLADTVIKALSGIYKGAYVDAQHARADEEASLPGRLASGAVAEYTDQINYHQFNYNQPIDQFRFRQLFADMDVVLVNGNHQQAKAQVVVLDETKKASLQKRVSQLTDVQLFLLADNADGVFDFVQEAIPAWQQVPLYKLSEKDKIISFFKEKLQQARPLLNGLVLAGGKSMRMGQDKGAITWHGKEQRYYMADLLQPFCEAVYISCQPEQQLSIGSSYKTVTDTFTGLGPYGAILSAFREQPDAAWLVVACDLPLLDTATLNHLTAKRNSAAIATTFQSPHDGFPEPLITIWEPKSYPLLLSFLAQGYSCPRKVLINSDTIVLPPLQPDALLNVNTPEEAARVKQIIQQRTTPD